MRDYLVCGVCGALGRLACLCPAGRPFSPCGASDGAAVVHMHIRSDRTSDDRISHDERATVRLDNYNINITVYSRLRCDLICCDYLFINPFPLKI